MTTNEIFKTGPSSKSPGGRRIFLAGFLGNISLAWKMVLMAFVLFLSTLGVAGAAYSGLQSMRYQLSNIYDFMLVPIVAISQADTSLANAQISLNNLKELSTSSTATPAEINKNKDEIEVNEEAAYESITRYANEWVTTVSPEFTQQLRDAGRLDLQEQEVIALKSLTTAIDEYEILQAEFYKSMEAGTQEESQERAITEKLAVARQHLQELIEINHEFADISDQQAQAAYRQALLNGGVVLSIGLVLGLFMSYLIVVSITSRLRELTRSAAAMQEGNLDQSVTVAGRDEVALLGATFNSMASQLKNVFGTLEQRVAARTRNLELAAEVGRAVSQVRNLDVMLKDACELILNEFNLYYVQVYLTDPGQTALRLEAGTGTVGTQLLERGHSLMLDTGSINGRAVVERQSVVIADTAQSATFRQNPLLPETRGEMAVPLIVADKVVGVLDMQSREPGVLNNEILPAFEALAGQLAVAIQNASLLEETNEARAEVQKQARRLVRQGWSEHLDAIHKPEQIGYVFDRKEVLPLVDSDEIRIPENSNTVSSSISVTGESLGSLVVEMDDMSRKDQAVELVNVVARQVAQQLENLRLLESAERYRLEAEEAARRTTVEGWQEFFVAKQNQTLSYLYDLNQVKPNSSKILPDESSGLSMPITVHDETMGKVVVLDMPQTDPQALALVEEITRRLGTHLDNLRLSQQTQERAQREHALHQFTSAVRASNNAESILRTAVRELGNMLGRKTIVRMTTTAEQSSQAHPAADPVGEIIANNGNEPVIPAESRKADGGNE